MARRRRNRKKNLWRRYAAICLIMCASVCVCMSPYVCTRLHVCMCVCTPEWISDCVGRQAVVVRDRWRINEDVEMLPVSVFSSNLVSCLTVLSVSLPPSVCYALIFLSCVSLNYFSQQSLLFFSVPSIRPNICPSIHLSIIPTTNRVSIHQFIFHHSFIHLSSYSCSCKASIHPSIYPPICL